MNLIDRAVDLLLHSHHAVALTGAGVSTHSGIPDFRSPGSGLWEHVDPYEVASLPAFCQRPEAFFNWIRPLARQMLDARPNPAHTALAQMEALGILKAVITQNIDGLHQKAGSQRVVEVHGHLRQATCIRCYRVFPSDQFVEAFLADGGLPRCPECGNVLKPNAILFGEQLPATAIRDAQRHTQQCDVMLVAGSSLEVAPASELPHLAWRRGAQLIIVNLQPTFMDDQAQVALHDDVATILPEIARACAMPTPEYDQV